MNDLKIYIGIIRLFGIITIGSVESMSIQVYSRPEKWSSERLKAVNNIIRPFCAVKWIRIQD